jgi:hypothetical protein
MMSVIAGSRGRRVAMGSIGLALAGIAVAACSDSLSRSGTREASISFGVVQNGAFLSAANVTLADLVISDDENEVDLTSADVVFGKITFKGTSAADDADSDSDDIDSDSDAGDSDSDDADSDSDSDGPGNTTFRAGAATVALPLEGGDITPFTGTIPVGTYRSIRMDADFVRLIGTYNGEAFDVTVPINAKLRQRFAPPMEVTEASEPFEVSVNIDVASWFKDADGNTIDPRLLNSNAEMRAHFRNRVRASFRAFEDEDGDHDEEDSDSDRSGSNSGQG